VASGVDILIGNTSQETRLFIDVVPALRTLAKVPVIGGPATSFVSWLITRKVYASAIGAFAQRHGRAGGRAYRYEFTWAPKRNALGSAHAIELALLFGDRQTWEGIEILRGASWEEIDSHGREMRQLWADFARGVVLPDRGGIPGVLTYARAR